ncbi:hypothetical protein EAG_05228 [Camponotus floridanus]|uniref:Uncharacterized protein n=1 Tax=Camponotus floridanus TaxID=104421 RepID=E2ARC6_CAMFO|nr:hypothetical protein EAG_05228 [Camponotus floridanus]
MSENQIHQPKNALISIPHLEHRSRENRSVLTHFFHECEREVCKSKRGRKISEGQGDGGAGEQGDR